MTLEYQKDGARVKLDPIYGTGKPGQIIVLTGVDFGGSESPLGEYSQPAFFTIKERRGDKRSYEYDLVDTISGKVVTIYSGREVWWFYDVNEWGQWMKGNIQEHKRRKDTRIQHLESQVDLLRGILIAQGVKVVTQEQLDALGIK